MTKIKPAQLELDLKSGKNRGPRRTDVVHFKACPRCNGPILEQDVDVYLDSRFKCLACGWCQDDGDKISDRRYDRETANVGTLGHAIIFVMGRFRSRFGLWRLRVDFVRDSMAAWELRGPNQEVRAFCLKVTVLKNPFGRTFPAKLHTWINRVFHCRTGLLLVGLETALLGETWTVSYAKNPETRPA